MAGDMASEEDVVQPMLPGAERWVPDVVLKFWEILGSSPMSNSSDARAALAGVESRLRLLEPAELVAFQEQLAIQLGALYRDDLASIPVEIKGVVYGQSDDHFLYARCACLLAGQEAVRRVMAKPERFAKFVSPGVQAEELMYLAGYEYKRRTGGAMQAVLLPD
ncbi:DUF4240 domain-containing protein [Actinokineospora globicatena]|uniref:DUF4240 domain-containing protein n=1 Tax=Actinokineospora globicatena TaxID=103729 RepID=UPI0020A4BD49|nr:DUF4240 domain-containing protein [Actinokineospora globicatena]MCP2300499.1 Protein of unknown function (DUF4240) [Actinokineospora globicatena]GLW81041.1 hypothetical protein Aglo01_55220 [Actinokineospora globicatena]GLW88234.1 hypothetical protein Aglo02_58730 [Actinokineospora globicatena]